MLLDARQFSVELLSVLLPLLLLLLPPLTQSPKAIFSATSLLSALVLLTNYSSGTKPFSVPTAQLFFFLSPMVVRPSVFVFPQRGTGPAKHAFCPSVLSLPKMVLVLQNINTFKLLSVRKHNCQYYSLYQYYNWPYLEIFYVVCTAHYYNATPTECTPATI